MCKCISEKISLSVYVGEGNTCATLCKSFDVTNQKPDPPRGKNDIENAVNKKFGVTLHLNLMKTLINRLLKTLSKS